MGTSHTDRINQPFHRERCDNIYITIDACADLGGTPYKLLKSLHDLYAITGNRNLYVVDTEQGYHEKSNATNPDIAHAAKMMPTTYGKFVQDNRDWVKIIPTSTCRNFQKQLADIVFPQIVMPMVEAVDSISEQIRQEAFAKLQESGQNFLHGERIEHPNDIDLRIEYRIPQGRQSGKNVFCDKVINDAATKVMAQWKKSAQTLSMLPVDDKEIFHKGFMVEMINAVQLIKAHYYMLCSQTNPELIAQMGQPVPSTHAQENTAVKYESYRYDRLKLPNTPAMLSSPEFMQSVRLTKLWPWSVKPHLTNAYAEMLDKLHKNTADISYLDLFSNHFKDLSSDMGNTLYVLVTHDEPLIEQMLEVATGVKQSHQRMRGTAKGEGRIKQEVLTPATIYEQYNLGNDASIYPKDAPMSGKTFLEFAYKQILAEFKPYIPPATHTLLKKKIKSPAHWKEAPNSLLATIKKTDMDFDLKQALENAATEVMQVKSAVEHDIRNYGPSNENTAYQAKKHHRIASGNGNGHPHL